MMLLDALMGKFQRLDCRGGCSLESRIDFGFGYRDADFIKIDPVETAGIIDERAVAFAAHAVDDFPCCPVHIFGRFALACQKCREIILEIGIGLSERLDHASVPSNLPNLLASQICLPDRRPADERRSRVTFFQTLWRGSDSVSHAAPRSVICASMHSTSRRIAAFAEKVSSIVPAGVSPAVN